MKITSLIITLYLLSACTNTADTQLAQYIRTSAAHPSQDKWCQDKKHQQFEEDKFYKTFGL